MPKLDNFTSRHDSSIIECIKKIDVNDSGYVVLVNKKVVMGVVTDGDIRRLFIGGALPNDKIEFNEKFEYLTEEDNFNNVSEIFRSEKINFLPILNSDFELVNIITKKQFHTLLLHDKKWDLKQDFELIKSDEINFVVFNRPWGFYKSTLLSEYVQSKIITLFPYSELSLQEHKRREEHWVVIKGKGSVVLGESIIDIYPGKYVYIPKGCKHQIINNSDKNIILTEVQLGDYFGEDDIIRYSDKYGRS